MSRNSNSKLGITLTAKDQASKDLEAVAKAFVETGGTAEQVNKDVERLSKLSGETVEREKLKAFVRMEAAQGQSVERVKALYDRAVQTAISGDKETAKSAAKTARIIENEWLSAVAKVERDRIDAAHAAAKAERDSIAKVERDRVAAADAAAQKEKEAQALRVRAANEHDGTALLQSTTLLGRLKNAIGLANTEAANIAPLEAMGGALGRLGPYAAAAGAALKVTAGVMVALIAAGGTAAAGIGHFAVKTAESVEETRVLATRVATTTETMSRFGYAARLVGADLDDAQDALGELGQRALNIPKDFERWGIATSNANGTLKTTEQLLFAVADRLQQTTSQTERLALADELMSDGGRRLLPVLEQGSAGLRAFFDEADRAGATIDAASAALAQRLVRQVKETDTALDAVSRRLGGVFQPAVTEAFEAAETVAGLVLQRITENEDSFQRFATGSVALLARGFALLVDVGSDLSYVAEGLVSVFTFRLGPAFDQARAVASDVAQEARFLAGELERGAEVTRDEVVPAVERESAARATLVRQLGSEKQAREDLRGAAGEAVADLLSAQSAAEALGQSQRADAQVVSQALLAQLERLDQLEGRLRGTKTSAADLALALASGGVEAARAVEGETEARRRGLRAQIAATRRALDESVEAAKELTAAITEEQEKQRAELAKTQAAELRGSNARLQVTRQLIAQQAQLAEEERTARAAAEAQEWEQRKSQVMEVGRTTAVALRQLVAGLADSSRSEGEVVLGVLENVGMAALDAAVAYGVEQGAIALVNATLGTKAALIAGTAAAEQTATASSASAATAGAVVQTAANKTAAASAITAAAAEAGAAAFAAYAGIPFVGLAIGTAASAQAVAQTLGFLGMLAFNQGGVVPGSGFTDSVPAMLTPGEVVFNRDQVDAIRQGAGAMPPQLHLTLNTVMPTLRTDYDRIFRSAIRPAASRSSYGGW